MIKLIGDTIDRQDLLALSEWILQDPAPQLTKGPLTIQLEKKWADYIGTKYSVFVNSGSSSILLSLAALKHAQNLRNNKIIVPGLSWATDISSPMLLGFDVFMCDCNLVDLSFDLNHLEQLLQETNAAVVLLVTPLGLVPDMPKLVELCQKYNSILLEDTCESMGSKYKNTYLGNFGFASFYSMYYGHHLSTIEGGFINTNDESYYHHLLMMRSHGWDRDLPDYKKTELRQKYNCTDFDALYNFYLPGFNLRATDLQAFLGIRAIDKLTTFIGIRESNFYTYKELIKNNELLLNVQPDNVISNFAFPVVCKNRDEIVAKLIANKIEVRPLIAGDMSLKPMWTRTHTQEVNLTNCRHINKYGFYLPNHPGITFENIKVIADIINS